MPTYEYRCAEGHRFEKFQRMSEPALDTCPECGAAAERLLSAGAGLLFKGSGFYVTDYRSEAYRKAAASDGGTAGEGGGAGKADEGGAKAAPAEGPKRAADPAPSRSKQEDGGGTKGGTAGGGEAGT